MQTDLEDYELFEPILDRILVKDISVDVNDGPFVTPDKYTKRSNEGEVMAVGQGVYMGGQFIAMPVAVGDIVKFGEFGPEPLTVDGEEFLLMRVQDLKGVRRAKGK